MVDCVVLVIGSSLTARSTAKDRRESLQTAIAVFELRAAAARQGMNISTAHETPLKASKAEGESAPELLRMDSGFDEDSCILYRCECVCVTRTTESWCVPM